ncbi:MAG: beta-hydroxyacyl-ACP dehydratase [Planctomycetes bacterium]|nr:beta-hydroxyacyl-ACP dehydratase [Planctomycetota bacterium]
MRWMWIDEITDFQPNQRMVAIKNIKADEEYLRDHFPDEPIYPASLMIEGMAQTAGILVGSINRFKEKVVLAKVLKAIFDCEVFPGQTIRFDAQLERMDDQGASTTGIVQRQISTDSEWETIGRIDLMFSHLDQNRAGLEFPEENFVFADNFKEILKQAGLENLADT